MIQHTTVIVYPIASEHEQCRVSKACLHHALASTNETSCQRDVLVLT